MPIIIPRTKVKITTLGAKYQTIEVPLDRLTASITLLLERPSTGNPLNWSEDGEIKIETVLLLDGKETRLPGGARDGVWTAAGKTRKAGRADYTSTWGLEAGYFGDVQKLLLLEQRRMGETFSSKFSMHVELLLVSGIFESFLTVSSVAKAMPIMVKVP